MKSAARSPVPSATSWARRRVRRRAVRRTRRRPPARDGEPRAGGAYPGGVSTPTPAPPLHDDEGRTTAGTPGRPGTSATGPVTEAVSCPASGPTRPPRPTAREYWAAATTPRMIGLFVLLVAAALVCIRLGAWQLDRAAIRGAERAQTEHSAKIDADPVPIGEVLRAQTGFTNEELAVHVEADGAYEPGKRVLVPGRGVDGEHAVLVVEAFRLDAGADAGALLPVVRGWLPADAVDLGTSPVALTGADDPAATDPALAPAAGAATTTVTGHLAGSEQAASGDLPEGAVAAISPAQLVGLWGGPGFSGYLVLDEPDAAALSEMPPPSLSIDTGMNLQNLFYALEWVVFGGFALALWVRMVRDQVRTDREDALLAQHRP